MSPRPASPSSRARRRRRMVAAARALSIAGVLAAASPAPAQPVAAPRAAAPASRLTLAAALQALQERGLAIVFTSEVVRPEMMVEGGMPNGDDPRQVLAELLAPHGLTTVEGPRGVLVVVPGAPRGDCAVAGEVRAAAGRPLAGAAVQLAGVEGDGAGRATESDAAGRFRFEGLPCGAWTLTAAAPGHLERSAPLRLTGLATVRIDLPEQPFLDEEIVVRPSRWSLVQDAVGGVLVLGREQLAELPQLGGDAVRAVERAPGVASSDVSASFAVRGGRRDEVEIRLDGQELYEPYHLKDYDSALSIVPSESLASMTLATGGLPASRGDRMGGVLELTTTAPSERRRVRIGLGPLHALAAGSGTLGPAAWSLTARAGSGQLARRVIGDREPRFWDAFGRLDLPFGERALGSGRVLVADDELDIDHRFEDASERVSTDYSSRYAWLTHDAVVTEGLFVTSRASWAGTRRDRLGEEIEDGESVGVRDVRRMEVAALASAWTWQRGERHRLELGAEARRFAVRLDYRNAIERPVGLVVPLAEPVAAVPRRVRDLDGDHLGVWASARATFGERLTAEVGLRSDRHTLSDETLLSPRLAAAWRLGDDAVLRASWGVFHQSQRPYELDVQDGQERLAPAERSRQWVVGYERLPAADGPLTSLRLEAFGRSVDEPRERFVSLFEPINIFPEAEPDRVRVVPRASDAEGVELLVRGRGGERLTWWLAYAYTDSRLTIGAAEVPTVYDQPHAVTLDVGWRLPRGWSLNAAWHTHTGWPTTPIVALHGPQEPDEEDGPEDGAGLEAGEGGAVLELGRLHSRRLPTYHRLDLRLSRRWPLGRSALRLFVDVQNLYDRGNLAGFDPDVDLEEGTVALDPESWPGIVPSFGVTWEL